MDLKQRLTDPLSILAAVLLGGLAAAVVALLGTDAVAAAGLGAAVAGVVYAVAVGLGSRMTPRSRTPAVDPDLREWTDRAAAAVAALRRQQRAARDPDLARMLGDAAGTAQGVAGQLRDRVRAAATVDPAAALASLDRLREERDRLAREAGALPPGRLRTEKESALRAAEASCASYQRLVDLRAQLVATVEATALQLDAVAARGSVLLSLGLATDTDPAQSTLDPLVAELTAAQQVLEVTEELTRQLLGPS